MSGTENAEKAIAESLRLKGAAAPVARLSRGSLIALLSVCGVGIAGAVALGLSNRPAKAQAPDVSTLAGPPPAALAALPKDYAAPKLGPPLPGDLGRPMAAASAQPTPPSAGTVQEAQQRAVQEAESARASRLFAADVHGDDGRAAPVTGVLADLATAVSGKGASQTTSPERLTSPVSPYVIQAGMVIPAALVTGIRSDLPGEVIGQVTADVFDSLTGRILLIPQGAKLLGSYDAQVTAGQTRVLLTWTRLILPNGRSMILEKLPGGDAQGYGGLQDRMDHHVGALVGAAALSTLLGVGAELGPSNTDSAIVSALRVGAAGSLNQAGQQIVGKTLSLPPVLTIRPGAPVRVLVSKDLVLEPYQA